MPKVLVSGAPLGNLDHLFSRVSKANAKSGPFDALFVTGPIFETANDNEAPEGSSDVASYVSGAKRAPIPTYFIGAYGKDAKASMRAAKAPPETEPPSDASQPNVFYLGRAGAVHLHGLTVTYLDGLYDVDAFELPPPPDAGDACSHHTQLDVDALRKSMRQLHKLDADAKDDQFPPADILITCAHPLGWERLTAEAEVPTATTAAPTASPAAAEAAALVRPRYHFVGGAFTAHARSPYAARGVSHVTRLVSLDASDGAKGRGKHLHALQLDAIPFTAPTAYVVPEGATLDPYETSIASNGAKQQQQELAAAALASTAWARRLEEAEEAETRGAVGGAAGIHLWDQSAATGAASHKRARTDDRGRVLGDIGWWRRGAGVSSMEEAKAHPLDTSRCVVVLGLSYMASFFDVISFFQGTGKQVEKEEEEEELRDGELPSRNGGGGGGGGVSPPVVVEEIRRGTRMDGKPNAFTHVVLADAESAARAVAQLASGHALCGREVRVEMAKERRSTTDASAGAAQGAGAVGAASQGPPPDCWFCLGSPTCATHLVAQVGEDIYVALDKSPIVTNHSLCLSIDHVDNALRLKPKASLEMSSTLARMNAMFAKDDGSHALLFERYAALRHRGGNHCHVNAIPLPASVRCEDAALKIAAFASQGGGGPPRAFQIVTSPDTCATFEDRVAFALETARSSCLGTMNGADREYVWFMLSNGTVLLHTVPNGRRMDLSFPRQAVCALLGCADRADWRQCVASGGPEEETKWTDSFREKLESVAA